MAQGHPQAFFHTTEVLASSDALDPVALLAALPERDGLRVSAVEGAGLVAARRRDDFIHLVSGVSAAIELWDADFWRTDPGDLELEALDAQPIDLAFLADAPPGVATRLLDAALAGPVSFSAPDEEQRANWIAWLTYALPDGAALTFSTAGDEGVRISAFADPTPDAIDTTVPCELAATLYTRVAAELAARGELREAVARLDEPDGLALAVYGGATHLIAPHQLPLALELITELATAGEVALAARAAAALPSAGPTTALVLHAEPAATELVAIEEPEEILDAEVVEEPERGPFEDLDEDDVIEVPFEPAPAEPEPEPEAEPGPFEALDEDDVIEVPFEVVPAEPVETEPEMHEPGDEDEEGLPDVDAWSSLLAELKSESVEPDESLPPLPDIEQGRVRDRFWTPPAPPEPEPEPEPIVEPAAVEPEPDPEPEPEPEAVETSVELGISLEAFAQSLSQAPEPVEETPPPAEEEVVIEEQEIGMSLADLEASLKRGEQP